MEAAAVAASNAHHSFVQGKRPGPPPPTGGAGSEWAVMRSSVSNGSYHCPPGGPGGGARAGESAQSGHHYAPNHSEIGTPHHRHPRSHSSALDSPLGSESHSGGGALSRISNFFGASARGGHEPWTLFSGDLEREAAFAAQVSLAATAELKPVLTKLADAQAKLAAQMGEHLDSQAEMERRLNQQRAELSNMAKEMEILRGLVADKTLGTVLDKLRA